MKRVLLASILVVNGALMLCAQTANEHRASDKRRTVPKVQTGTASFYSAKFKFSHDFKVLVW